jgi:tRNA(fMet)-specific endonuclease VapC
VRYVLDTNTISDLIRDPRGRVAQRIAEVGENEVSTSIVVAAELRYGAAKKGSKPLSTRIDRILGALEILALEQPADAQYGRLRARLESNGRVIGANDMLIAAQVLSRGLTLVTDNEREFRSIDGLPVENWLRERQ